MNKANRFLSIQVARGLGAMMVLIWHLEWLANDMNLLAELQIPPALSFGYAGVDLFFVVSGFVMADIALSGKPLRAADFTIHRFLRVYPPYWIATLCETVLLALSGRLNKRSFGAYMADYAIFPQRELPLLGVGWTLEHEVIFYCEVALLGLFGIKTHVVAMLGSMTSMALIHAFFFRPSGIFMSFRLIICYSSSALCFVP